MKQRIAFVELGPVESLDKEFFVEESDMEHTSSGSGRGKPDQETVVRNLTDLELTKLCAEALGWKHLGAVGVEPPKRGEPDPKGLWCLGGGNDWWVNPKGHNVCGPCSGVPDPLNNDSDAMALVKKMELDVSYWRGIWTVDYFAPSRKHDRQESNRDLNRAIVECVAKMQASRTPEK